ncbi:Serine/threonine-protein kinase, partial [Elasticomyces elasticus]
MSHSSNNANSAADLLRQAMAQNANKRMPEDLHDSILSGAQTPSGIQTPQPDFQDKRLPGILNGFFGQVGNQASSKSQAHPLSTSMSASQAFTLEELEKSQRSSRRGSTASHISLVEIERHQATDTPPTSDDMNYEEVESV